MVITGFFAKKIVTTIEAESKNSSHTAQENEIP